MKELEREMFQLLGIKPSEGGWVLDLLTTIGTSVIFYCLYRVTAAIHQRLAARITNWQQSKVRSFKIQNYELLDNNEVTQFVLLGWKSIGYLIYLLYAYLYLNSVFLFFPKTERLAQTLLGSLLDIFVEGGMAVISYLPSLLFLVVLFYISKGMLKICHHFFQGLKRDEIKIAGFYSEWAEPTYKLLRIVIILFMIIIAFPYLPGSGSPAFKGISIFLGVLVSLGGSSTVANVISGIMLTYMRAFQIGDRVKIAEAEGDIVERTLFVTRIRTIKNVEITIPNIMVLNNHIINYSTQAKNEGVTLHTTITIGYDVPWNTVHDLLLAAADVTDQVEKTPKPFILQTKLDDFYVHYELNGITHQPDKMGAIYSDLHQHILDQFNAAGVEIASPHFRQLRDGNSAILPDQYLPKNYTAGGFKIFPWNTDK